jgi:hypothetical protein
LIFWNCILCLVFLIKCEDIKQNIWLYGSKLLSHQIHFTTSQFLTLNKTIFISSKIRARYLWISSRCGVEIETTVLFCSSYFVIDRIWKIILEKCFYRSSQKVRQILNLFLKLAPVKAKKNWTSKKKFARLENIAP